jgi:hypothetical protein
MASTGTLRDDEKIPFTLSGVDGGGNPEPIHDAVVSLSDQTKGTVEMNPDGLTGFFVAAGPFGPVQVHCRALNALDEAIEGTGDLTILQSAATRVVVDFGSPLPKA